MNSRTPLKLAIMGASFLFAGALIATLDQTPMNWMKSTLLQALSATTSVAHANPFAPETQGKDSFHLVKQVRPALNPNSPEVLERKKHPKGPPQGQPPQLSKEQLLDQCQKRPSCAAKLKAIKSGKRKPHPVFKGKTPPGLQKKKKTSQIGQPGQLGSEISLPEEAPSLLSWLNPFQVKSAYAQTTPYWNQWVRAGYPRLGNQVGYLRGASLYSGRHELRASHYYKSGATTSWTHCNVCENNPYAVFQVEAPYNGIYFLSAWVYSTDGGPRKGKMCCDAAGKIMDSWDYSPGNWSWTQMGTTEELPKGLHKIYFWPTEGSGNFVLYGINIVLTEFKP